MPRLILWAAFAMSATVAFSAEPPQDRETAVLFYRVESTAAPGLKRVQVEGTKDEPLFLHEKPFLTGREVASAKVNFDEQGNHAIDILLSPSGRETLAKVTGEFMPRGDNNYKRIALVVDGKVIFAPVVRSKIDSDTVRVSGRFSETEAKEIAKRLANPQRSPK